MPKAIKYDNQFRLLTRAFASWSDRWRLKSVPGTRHEFVSSTPCQEKSDNEASTQLECRLLTLFTN